MSTPAIKEKGGSKKVKVSQPAKPHLVWTAVALTDHFLKDEKIKKVSGCAGCLPL
jgi:hypothetical protein